ncbi:MAG: glycosyltransferase family 4 protein [Acidimicrobiia bacterium]
MSSRPRLVHVTTTDISLALLLGPQLRAFAAAGYDVTGMSADGPYVAELRDAGIDHVALRHATRASAPWRDMRALGELCQCFRRLAPDIVHTHNPKPGVYGRLAGRAARVPAVVNTVHGLYALPSDRWAKRAFVYGLERLAAACSDGELVQNPEDLEVLARLGVPQDRLHLLGNGIDLERFDPARTGDEVGARVRRELGVGPDEVVVGAVGRLVEEKGYRELMAAAVELRARCPQVRIVVAGPTDADKADALSEKDQERGRREAGVVFLGLRRDVESLYAAMDVYVLASYREGFPRSAMEAAAMGLPIVATDIRGCRQVVDTGSTGLLVPPRDSGALAAAIVTLASDEPLRRKFGQAGRKKALREFDQRQVIDITLGLYERVLHSARRRGALVGGRG